MLPRLLLVYHSRGYVYDYVGNNRSNNSECNFFVKIIIIYGLLISSSRIFHQRLEQKKKKNVEGRVESSLIFITYAFLDTNDIFFEGWKNKI